MLNCVWIFRCLSVAEHSSNLHALELEANVHFLTRAIQSALQHVSIDLDVSTSHNNGNKVCSPVVGGQCPQWADSLLLAHQRQNEWLGYCAHGCPNFLCAWWASLLILTYLVAPWFFWFLSHRYAVCCWPGDMLFSFVALYSKCNSWICHTPWTSLPLILHRER